jgi:hypothetical protein
MKSEELIEIYADRNKWDHAARHLNRPFKGQTETTTFTIKNEPAPQLTQNSMKADSFQDAIEFLNYFRDKCGDDPVDPTSFKIDKDGEIHIWFDIC